MSISNLSFYKILSNIFFLFGETPLLFGDLFYNFTYSNYFYYNYYKSLYYNFTYSNYYKSLFYFSICIKNY